MGSKNSYFKFGIGFLTLIILGLALNYFWQTNFSPAARANRQMEEQYKKYQEFVDKYKQAMTADTYGGKTPQETLDLFVAALEKGDIELASKYFMLKENGERDEKWLLNLEATQKANRIIEIVSTLKKAIPAGSSMKDVFGFEIRNEEGNIVGDVGLSLNTYSQVWKIESL